MIKPSVLRNGGGGGGWGVGGGVGGGGVGELQGGGWGLDCWRKQAVQRLKWLQGDT